MLPSAPSLSPATETNAFSGLRLQSLPREYRPFLGLHYAIATLYDTYTPEQFEFDAAREYFAANPPKAAVISASTEPVTTQRDSSFVPVSLTRLDMDTASPGTPLCDRSKTVDSSAIGAVLASNKIDIVDSKDADPSLPVFNGAALASNAVPILAAHLEVGPVASDTESVRCRVNVSSIRSHTGSVGDQVPTEIPGPRSVRLLHRGVHSKKQI